MSLPFWCVLLAVLLTYIPRIFVGKAMKEEGSGYDNHNPRIQQARLTGLGARALAAHLNSIEMFPLFLAGVLMAHTTDTRGWLVDGLALTFIVARLVFLFCYLRDLSTLRSLAWFVSLLCCLVLMLSPAL